jgi:hypothetical protein
MSRKDGLLVAAVVAALIVFGIVVVRSLGGPGGSPGPEQAALQGPPAGTAVALPGVDWGRGDRTLLLVLSKGCHFCSESARFYRRLAREAGQAGGVQLVAVLPQDVATGRGYLAELGVNIPEVRSAALDTLHAPGTPTLILADRTGRVVDSWVGLLPPDREEEVVEQVLGRPAA